MKRLLLLCFLVALPIQAMSQPRQVVTNCGTQTLVAGDSNNGYITTNGLDCVSGSTSGGVAGITITNKSSTITVGGDATQIAIAANPNRVTCHIQPQASDMYINPATTAPLSRLSEFIPVLSEFTCPAGYKGAIAISGLTTGSDFYADEGTVP